MTALRFIPCLALAMAPFALALWLMGCPAQ